MMLRTAAMPHQRVSTMRPLPSPRARNHFISKPRFGGTTSWSSEESRIIPRSVDYTKGGGDQGVLAMDLTTELQVDDVKTVFGWPRNFEEKYDMGNLIGCGSFGMVHECFPKGADQSTDKLAVKKISKVPKRGKCTPRYLLKLRSEVEIMEQLGYSLDAVNLKDVFEDDDHIYMIMDLCSGGELLQRIEKSSYSEKYIASLVRGILRFISQCHARGVIYRDVKPDNFLFQTSKDNSPLKATDFGLAITHTRDEPKLTVRSGTPAYMAPELVMQSYDEKCDVWSVGMVTYQLLTGRFPYWEDVRMHTLNDVWRSIMNDEIDWEAVELRSLSHAAVDFLKQLLERDPEKRVAAADALKHPWVSSTDGEAEDVPLASTVVQRLQRFSTYGRLKQQVLQMIYEDMEKEWREANMGSPDSDLRAGERQSFIQSVQDFFIDIDTDSSGAIDMQELQEGLKRHGYYLTDSEVAQLASRIDFDGSGDIDLNELMITLMDWSLIQQEKGWKKYLDKAFDKLDLNGNGLIELHELEAALVSSKGFTASGSMETLEMKAEARQMLREADTNGDGEISREEFYNLLQDSWAQDALSLYDSRRDLLKPEALPEN